MSNFNEVYHQTIEILDTVSLETIFERIHNRLHVKYALESLSFSKGMFDIWKKLLDLLKSKASIGYFVSRMIEHPPPDSSSWIPKNHVAAFFPEIFTYSKSAFEKINGKNSVLLNCLHLFTKFNNPFHLFSQLLHTAATMGFSNPQEIQDSKLPVGFDLKRYQDVLKLMNTDAQGLSSIDEWRPGNGDYLGPKHYRYAISEMKKKYRLTISGNAKRRGSALACIKNLKSFNLSRYTKLYNQNNGFDLILHDSCNTALNEQDDTENEFFTWMIHFFSLFAQVCRIEQRNTGALKKFLTDLIFRNKDGYSENKNDPPGILSFLFFIGEEVLAFFLLLWELVFTCDLDFKGGHNGRN